MRRPKVSIMSATLVLLPKLQVVQRAARHLVGFVIVVGIPNGFSIFQLRPDQGGIGSLTPDILVLMILLTKLSVLLAVPVILSMWEPQDRLLEISTPRYQAHVTVM